MKLTAIKSLMMSKTGPMLLKWAKIKPSVMTYGGIIGVGVSTVLACRATLKAVDVLEESKKNVATVHKALEEVPEKYSEEDAKKDLVMTYTQTCVKMVKLYALPAAVGALSVACIVGGHKVLRKENFALSAAYTGLSESFKEYRKRVRTELGEDKDREIMNGVKAEEIVVTDEDGNEIKKKSLVKRDANISMYARFFDRGNEHWCKNPQNSLNFLRAQQSYANNVLQSRGYITLNEVYDLIGLPKSIEGQFVGWVKNYGDNYVDFGIFTRENDPQVRDFVNGFEEAILLDFNVDGNINFIYGHLNPRGTYDPNYTTPSHCYA